MLISEAIAQLRGLYKLLDQDSNKTDRFLYQLLKTTASFYLRRQDSLNRIKKFNGIYQPLDFVPLVEVDSIRANCAGAPTWCRFMRTKDRLPSSHEGYYGPLLRSVTSLDLSVSCQAIYPTQWRELAKQKTFKYNKTKYYWYLDGYLYFPNVDWEAIALEGVFEFDVRHLSCEEPQADCVPRQQSRLAIPEHLFLEIKQQIKQDLGLSAQLPTDSGQDNKHPLN